MLKNIIFCFLFLCFSSGIVAQGNQAFEPDFSFPEEIPGYKLSWHDEFNREGIPDTTNWIFEQGFVRNEELQWYQSENAYCKNGVLLIEGRREEVSNPYYKEGSKNWKKNRKKALYTSSALETRGKREFLYGRFLIRARIDTSLGSWPAIWMLGSHHHWPLDGEIDIMEFYRWNNAPKILANAAWGSGPVWNTTRHPLAHFIEKDPEWPEKFHIWRMDWNKDFIKIYLDDELLNRISLEKTINPDGSNPFHQPQFFLLNLAIGATGGDPTHSQFPLKYEVDYVRYYQQSNPE